MITKEKIDEISSLDYFPNVVISLIKNKDIPDSFNKELEQKFPEISNELLSSSLVENCSCDKKIFAHIILKADEWVNFLHDFNSTNNISDFILEAVNKEEDLVAEQKERMLQENSKINLSGKIAKTSIDDWKDFSQKINETCTFKSFSVIKDNNNILVFFL